jgi:hypothetical protein
MRCCERRMLRGARGQSLSRRVPSHTARSVFYQCGKFTRRCRVLSKINFPEKVAGGSCCERARRVHTHANNNNRKSLLPEQQVLCTPAAVFFYQRVKESNRADVSIFLSRPACQAIVVLIRCYIYDCP